MGFVLPDIVELVYCFVAICLPFFEYDAGYAGEFVCANVHHAFHAECAVGYKARWYRWDGDGVWQEELHCWIAGADVHGA